MKRERRSYPRRRSNPKRRSYPRRRSNPRRRSTPRRRRSNPRRRSNYSKKRGKMDHRLLPPPQLDPVMAPSTAASSSPPARGLFSHLLDRQSSHGIPRAYIAPNVEPTSGGSTRLSYAEEEGFDFENTFPLIQSSDPGAGGDAGDAGGGGGASAPLQTLPPPMGLAHHPFGSASFGGPSIDDTSFGGPSMAKSSTGKRRKVSSSSRGAPQPIIPAVFITAAKMGKKGCTIDTTKDNLVGEKRVCVCCTVPGKTPQEAKQSVGQRHHILCTKCYNRIYKNYQKVMGSSQMKDSRV